MSSAHRSSSFAAQLRHSAGLCRCRHEHVEISHHATSAEQAALNGRPFTLPGTTRKYERDRPFAIQSIDREIDLDVPEASVDGVATLKLHRVDAAAKTLHLDAVGFTLHSVERHDHGKSHAARYSYDDATLSIEIPHGVDDFSIVIKYRATPKRGLYFLAPDDHVTDRPRQVWSQCQDEDARMWFPCHDKPHVKQPTSMRVRAPKGWYVLSNGELTSHKNEGDRSVYHWVQKLPHPSYLVTLVAGELSELKGDRDVGVPVTYLVPKGREADGARSFARTPEMIQLFEGKTGVKFPWSKYAQVVVSDFIFGGMENTSATTMYEHILLDERAAIDVDMDSLVAHELAHQWFGDYVTCRDWSEGWLNEGWATYMELVWKDEGTPPGKNSAGVDTGFGRDEYDYAIKGELDVYLAEDGARYRRPIVCRDYDQPIDLFDRHLYQKGGLVLHALRRSIGDGAFWSAVQSYLHAHAHGNVETRDFQRALEAASGRSLDRLFDLYVYGGGHPELEITVDHDAETKLVSIGVRQTQTVDALTRLYEGPLVVELKDAHGARRETLKLTSARDSFVLKAEVRPTYVAIDPDGDLLATFDLKLSGDLLRGQLTEGSRPRLRWVAAMALGKKDDPKTVAALAKALADEKEFWAVRVEAAQALGELRGEAAFEALREALKTASAKVRRAAAQAIAHFKTAAAAEALKPLALADKSYLVQAEASRSLGMTRQTVAFETLVELLDRKSWADVVRSAAAEGLGALRDERAVPHLTSRTAYGHASSGRRACMIALAKLDPS
ncbi:MAG: M1 family aminopeptidase, partial [Polyangiales bacterium]